MRIRRISLALFYNLGHRDPAHRKMRKGKPMLSFLSETAGVMANQPLLNLPAQTVRTIFVPI